MKHAWVWLPYMLAFVDASPHTSNITVTFASCCCRAAAVLLVRPLQTATSGCGAHLSEDVGMGLMKHSPCMVVTSSIKTATLICHSCLSHTLEALQHPSLQVPCTLPNVARRVLAGLIDICMHLWLCSCKQMMCISILCKDVFLP